VQALREADAQDQGETHLQVVVAGLNGFGRLQYCIVWFGSIGCISSSLRKHSSTLLFQELLLIHMKQQQQQQQQQQDAISQSDPLNDGYLTCSLHV
jgi:hypothetical protein